MQGEWGKERAGERAQRRKWEPPDRKSRARSGERHESGAATALTGARRAGEAGQEPAKGKTRSPGGGRREASPGMAYWSKGSRAPGSTTMAALESPRALPFHSDRPQPEYLVPVTHHMSRIFSGAAV